MQSKKPPAIEETLAKPAIINQTHTKDFFIKANTVYLQCNLLNISHAK